jgi:hypothetical protein
MSSIHFADKRLKTDDTLASNFNSDPLYMDKMVGGSIEAVITSSDAIGTFKIQTSNNNVDWVDYPSSSDSIASANKNIMWNIAEVYFRYMRVVYTRTGGGGAGTLCNIYVILKDK